MARKFQYVTLDRIISKLYRDLGLEEISETDVVEWSGEALEGIGAITLYEEAVAFIEVKDHHFDLPIGTHSIIQIAKNNSNTVSPVNIILDCTNKEITSTTVGSGCGCDVSTLTSTTNTDKYPIPLDCNGTPIIDYDVAYYRPYFDLKWEYSGWMDTSYYKASYTPVRLANHSFFNSIVCPENDNLYQASVDEYTVVGDKIRTSFKDGSIAISYTRQKIDPKTGYPMIPDDYSIITAITMYITMKYMGRLWYMGREGYSDKYQKAEVDWQWYCKQAGNKALMPTGIDEHQNILETRNQLIPNHRRYYGFFGKLGRVEDKTYRNSLNHGREYNQTI